MAQIVLHLLTIPPDGRKANPELDRSMRYALRCLGWRVRGSKNDKCNGVIIHIFLILLRDPPFIFFLTLVSL